MRSVDAIFQHQGAISVVFQHAGSAAASFQHVGNLTCAFEGIAGPVAPSGLTATVVSSSQIDLDWVDNASDEDTYEVQRSTDQITWTVLTTTLPANTIDYSSTGLSGSTLYYYRVRGIKNGYQGDWSNVASATTPAQFLLRALFTAADGTLLTAYTNDDYELAPATWGASVPGLIGAAGAMVIESNRARGNDNSLGTFFGSARIELTQADRDMTFNLQAHSSVSAGGDPHYVVGVRGNSAMTQVISLSVTRTGMTLGVLGGSSFATGSITTWFANETHTLRILCESNRYRCYWDGSLIIDYTDGTSTYTANPWMAIGARWGQLYEEVEVINA